MPEDQVLPRFTASAEATTAVRALVLNSSGAIEGAPLDALSDYDLLVAVPDLEAFTAGAAPGAPSGTPWYAELGPPLVTVGGSHIEDGFDCAYRLVLYADHVKVDYQLWPLDLLRRAASRPVPPDILDVGYRVLVDKHGVAAALPPATARAHIPTPPTAEAIRTLVEEFWWDAFYVAKFLWRDELPPARYSLDVDLRRHLLTMLEWLIETEPDWSQRPGRLSRHLKPRLASIYPTLWPRLEATFATADIEANWHALDATLDLFTDAARLVAARLGHSYPDHIEAGVRPYLNAIRVEPRP